jgi:gas vesicle protein
MANPKQISPWSAALIGGIVGAATTIVGATWVVRGYIDEIAKNTEHEIGVLAREHDRKIDELAKENDVRATEISESVKVIKGFLKEKFPEFSNFARKESLSIFEREVTENLGVVGAQTSVGTLNRIDPKAQLVALESKENQTENFKVPPEAEVWVYSPNLRRVRRLSSLSGLENLPAGTAVVVYYTERGSSGREVRRIVVGAKGGNLEQIAPNAGGQLRP